MKIIGKILKYTICTGLVLVLSIAGFLTFKGYMYYQDLQRKKPLDQLMLQVENRDDFIPFEDLPQDLFNATVAIEDKRFVEHSGIDYFSLIRAILSQFTPARSGGSTITQQTAKNLYELYDTDLDRKFAEIFMAMHLEKNYSKGEIFAVYVNIINYGDLNMGIYQASTNYFHVHPSQLRLEQCAILAGIPQSPANYQLSNHYDKAKIRQKQVLKAMADCGYIQQ
ncbi:MAG: transglycosylase domain-containing protein, partial [Holdemanella sp.]|nr:transglycosylase domain-containing protein [Holdemanella sp.]